MAVLDFLRRKHTVIAAYYHHATPHADAALQLVERYCDRHGIPLLTGYLTDERPPRTSPEEWWRECRYGWFESLAPDLEPIVTGHNLEDCVETYLWGALHGTPKLIPLRRGRVIRPFLTTRKSEFIDWCTRHGVAWVEDASNTVTRYTRNYIRHQLMPHALRVNPGIHKTVKRMLDNRDAACDNQHSQHNLEHTHG